MRYAFVITGLLQGGIETYILRFIKYYKPQVKPVIICNKTEINNVFYNEYIKAGARIYFIPINFNPINIYNFIKTLRKEKINILCDFRGDFAGLSIFISYLIGIKKRVVFYREDKYQFKMDLHRYIYIKLYNKLVQKFTTNILSNSEYAFTNFFGKNFIKNKKFKVIRNGVYSSKTNNSYNHNLKKILKIPDDAFIIGHVGRFANQKNYATIIEVANTLTNLDKDVYILLCGRSISSSLSNIINNNSFSHNLTNNQVNRIKVHRDIIKNSRIIMPGHCDDILSYYRIMDAFFFPSISEGSPNSLIEAIILKIPIVTSNINPIIEILPEELHQITFDPNDISSYCKNLIEIKSGSLKYNTNKMSSIFKRKFDQGKRFKEFMNILKI